MGKSQGPREGKKHGPAGIGGVRGTVFSLCEGHCVLTHKDGGEAEGVLAETVHLHLAHLYQLQWDIIGQGDSFLPHCTTDLSIAVGAEGVFKPNSHGKAFVPD